MGMLEGVDRRVLRLGGLSGLLAGAIILVGLALAFTLPAAVLSGPEGFFQSSPEAKGTFLAIGRLGYVAPFLYLPFVLALYNSLGKSRPTLTLLGSILGITAAAAFEIFFLGVVSTSFSLADYYAAAAPGDRDTVVIAAVAAISVLNGVQNAGFFFLGVSFISLGVSALGNAAFHKGFGWLGVVLGILVIALPFVGGPGLARFTLWAVFTLVLGGKLYSLSQSSAVSAS